MWSAHLRMDSPRYEDWFKILGTVDVPIVNPKSQMAVLGDEQAEIYKLDLDRLDFKQRERLARWIAEIVLDKKTLEPKYDERGRNVWRVRKHDIEEFQAIVERHGCYKRDLENFAKSLLKKTETPLLAGLDKPDKSERIVIPIAAKPKGGRPSPGASA
jgi:hypothetical protein